MPSPTRDLEVTKQALLNLRSKGIFVDESIAYVDAQLLVHRHDQDLKQLEILEERADELQSRLFGDHDASLLLQATLAQIAKIRVRECQGRQ